MALSSAAPSCEFDPWRHLHDDARKAVREKRFFEAVQLVNSALEAFEVSLGDDSVGDALLLTNPPAFVQQVLETGNLRSDAKETLVGLYATRADVLMNLGGLRRAATDLDAALLLCPGDKNATELRSECYELEKTYEDSLTNQSGLAVRNKIPAHILTGFLGSGKTTLLNHVLTELHGQRLAIIENEFGEIGVDDALIVRREDVGAEQIIEMNNGCICCTVRGDLIKGLRSILKRTSEKGQHLDGVIIETTGLADPAPVAQTFFADDYVQNRMVLDGIITVVDAKHVLQHLHEEKPEGVENEAVEQIAFADRVLLNKIDLVSPQILEEVEAEIRKINHLVPIIRTQHSRVHPQEIIGIQSFSLDRVLAADVDFLRNDQEHQHDQTVSSVGVERLGECDLEHLNMWIATLLKEKGTDIFRMKGILAIKGASTRFVFQGIHMIFGGQAQGEWDVGESRANRLVFIGRNLDRDELVRGFESTLVAS